MNRAEIRQHLVDHYLDYYALAYSMLEDADDASDTVQEALARTLAAPMLRDPSHYCYQTVRRLAVDTLRRRQVVVPMSRTAIEDEAQRGDDGSYAELLERVRHLRNGLPQALRSLLTLRYEKELTIPELAKLTGLSVMTVRRRLHEAKRIMKERLEDTI